MQIQVTLDLSEQSRSFKLKGRLGWAMVQLANAGKHGITPITRPAPLWSAYVFSLKEHGVPIQTVMEAHDGSYPGQHARYVLTCKAKVQILSPEPEVQP